MKSLYKLSIIAGIIAVSALISYAQPYYVGGDFNAWNFTNQMTGGPDQYDFTITGGTPGDLAQLKVTDGTSYWPSQNLAVQYDSTGSATIHFYPGSSNDGWLPTANRVGYDDPDNSVGWGLAGDFNSWDGTQTILAPLGNGVYSNSFVVATASTFGFKFQSPPGNWTHIYFGADFGNNNANGSFTTTNSPQTVPVILDLPHGRYFIGQAAPAPVTNQITFAVDMGVQLQVGNFNPSADTVFVSGTFNNWPGTSTNALVLTNYPAYNGGSNTNIYYATATITDLPGTVEQYKFTCTDPAFAGGDNGYEQIANNRTFNLLNSNGDLTLPVVNFGDLVLSDYLPTDTTVTFTVNMTNAVSSIDGHVFDPDNDSVSINGNFLPGGWESWDPISLSSSQMQNDPVGSEIYTYTTTVPAGSPTRLSYLYSIVYASATNYVDEGGANQNHLRDVRITAAGSYNVPEDTFGNRYAEPDFGQLNAAGAAPDNISVTWLGRPGVELQATTNLVNNSWQTIAATDGTNWISGYSSTNGFVSQTNWPSSDGQHFFRLIKAW